jgi:hypothetical protein
MIEEYYIFFLQEKTMVYTFISHIYKHLLKIYIYIYIHTNTYELLFHDGGIYNWMFKCRYEYRKSSFYVEMTGQASKVGTNHHIQK